MKNASTAVVILIAMTAVPAVVRCEQSAIPLAVTAANYTDLLQRPPFRRVLTLSESLVLSGLPHFRMENW
jgi:hypothetical protein